MPHAKHSAMNGFPNRKSQAVIERQSTVIALQRKISEQMALLTAMEDGDGRTVEYRRNVEKSNLIEQTIRELINELHEAQQ